MRYRFNWNTPYILSNHNPSIFYGAGAIRVPLGEARRRTEGDLAGIDADEQGQQHGSGRVAAQPRRALGRHRRRQSVGDEGRRREVDRGIGQRGESRLAGARWVATIEASRFVEGRPTSLSTATAPTTTSRTSS